MEATQSKELAALHISVLEVQRSVIRLEAFCSRVEDHEHRVRELEAFSNKAKGAMFFAASMGSLVGGLIVTLLTVVIG